jgi:hypothetical protein
MPPSFGQNILEVVFMAKKGMKRISRTHVMPKNTAAAVPEISGRAKSGAEKARNIVAGTEAPSLKVYHKGSAITKKDD